MSSGTSSPPIQPSIFLETSDGVSHEVEWEITTLCPLLYRELLHNNRGTSETSSVVLPSGVDGSSLERILEYCRFHLVPGRSNEEHMRFDKHFDELGGETLSNLLLAATSLELEPLACRVRLAMAQKVDGRTPAEVRESLQLPIDLTEKEELERNKISAGATPLRLPNTLHPRKGGKMSVAQSGSAEGGHRDDRSIDDLLSYIEGSEEDGKGTRKSKLKKIWWDKKKKKEQQARDSTLAENPKDGTQSAHSTHGTRQPTDASRDSQEAHVIGETDVRIGEEVGYDSADLDAATSLEMEPLACRVLLAMEQKVNGLTPAEVSESLQLPIDLTEKEKLEQKEINAGDTPFRLLNTLHARKGGKTSVAQSGSAEGGHRDDRSIDDLLSYIEGSEDDGQGTRKTKLTKIWWEKKKKKKKKQQARDSTLAESPKNRTQSVHSTHGTRQPTDASSNSQEVNVIGETDVGIDEQLGYDSAELDDDNDDDDWHPDMVDVGTQTSP